MARDLDPALPALFQEIAEVARILWPMLPEVVAFVPEGAGFVPYQTPGSSALGRATVEALRSHQVCLWEKHGALATGLDPASTFDLIDTLDNAARIYFLCRAAGREPEGLSRERMDELRALFAPEVRP